MPALVPGAVELAKGLHRWVAFHPEWKQDVACVGLEAGRRLVLIDPLVPPDTRGARAFRRALDAVVRTKAHVDVLITLHYHERSGPEVADRYREAPGATLWAPSGSIDRMTRAPDRGFDPGDSLPGKVEALPTGWDGEVVLWLPRQRTIVSGDALLGGKRKPLRVCPASWLPRGVTRREVAHALAPLRELDVQLVIPLHGDPVTDNAADVLATALDDASS